MSRPTGPKVTALSGGDGASFFRESKQVRDDLVREIGLRRFWSRPGEQTRYLCQMDGEGRLIWYALSVVGVTGKRAPVWRKIAELSSGGNLRLRGTLTQSVAFDASEDL